MSKGKPILRRGHPGDLMSIMETGHAAVARMQEKVPDGNLAVAERVYLAQVARALRDALAMWLGDIPVATEPTTVTIPEAS